MGDLGYRPDSLWGVVRFFESSLSRNHILIAAGALISEGVLDPFSSTVAGIMGAVLGDAISFWIGRKFGPLLPTIWPFRAHPERLAHGIRFFGRYGETSVFIGRFFGPLRLGTVVSAAPELRTQVTLIQSRWLAETSALDH